MKSASIHWLRGAAALLLLLGMGTVVRAADKADVNGTWTWTQAGRNGGNDVKFTLKLKVDGDKVTGTLAGANGSEIEIKDGKLTDNEVTFKVVRERNGTEIATTYTGKVEGDTLTGKIKSPGRNGGEGRSRDWKATREKAPAA